MMHRTELGLTLGAMMPTGCRLLFSATNHQKRTPAIGRWFGLVLILLLAFPLIAYAAPPVPSSFYGTVQISGIPAPAGTVVSAWVNGTKIAETTIALVGNDSVYTLDVLGDNPDTLAIEGGIENAPILFQINGIQADQTAVWHVGTYTKLDLTSTPPATAPVAHNQNVPTNEDGLVAITLTAYDPNNDPLTFTVVTTPTHGTLAGAAPNLTYTPQPNYYGADSFTFRASDGQFNSNVATIAITVNPVNDPPKLAPLGDLTLDEGTVRTIVVSAVDPDHIPVLSVTGLPAFATFTDNHNGTGTLRLAPGYNDAGVYPSITVRATDGQYTDSKSFALTVNDAEPRPVATFTASKGMNVARLADGATVAGYSSMLNTTWRPENAINDSIWCTAVGQTTNQWLKVKLTGERLHVVDRVIVAGRTGTDGPKDIEIGVSTTGSNDTDFTTVFAGVVPKDNNLHTFSFAPLQARYLQLRILNNWGSTSNICVGHLQAWTRDRQGGIVSLLEGPQPSVVAFSSYFTSGPYDVSQRPEAALDDNAGTYWSSANGQTTNQYMDVLLAGGRTHTIDHIRLQQRSDTITEIINRRVRDFEVWVSTTTAEEAAFRRVLAATAANDSTLQEFILPGGPIAAKYVRYKALNNRGSACCIATATFQVLTPQGHNVARKDGVGAFVVGYSSQNQRPEYAIDFDTSSKWTTPNGQTTNQWIKVLLVEGGPYLIDRIKLQSYSFNYSLKHFQLRVSTTGTADGDFSTVLDSTLPNDGQSHWFTFPPVLATYVQLYIFDNYSGAFTGVADFQVYSSQLGEATVPFDDGSSDLLGQVIGWNWNFGDGATATARHPLHTFPAPGAYTITLTVTNDRGVTNTTALAYEVFSPPVIDFTWSPTDLEEGESVTFTDQSTPAPNSVFLDRTWEFSIPGADHVSEKITLFLSDSGAYPIRLEREDSHLLSASTTYTINVANLPPVVNAGIDATLPVSFTWSPTITVTDPGQSDVPTLMCAWDFGDGQSTTQKCSSPFTHTYELVGVYAANLTATDKEGAVSNTDEVVVTVHKRKSALSIYRVESTAASEAVVEVALVDESAHSPMAGRSVSLSWAGQIFDLTTNASGIATTTLPLQAEEAISLTAQYAGSIYHEPASTTLSTTVSRGRQEYWLAFPTGLTPYGYGLYLYISSEFTTTGIVAVPGLHQLYQFTVSPGAATTVELQNTLRLQSPLGANFDATGIEDKGIYVTAAKAIHVYGFAYSIASSEAYLGLSTQYLGTDYIIVGYKAGRVWSGYPSLYAIAAAEDNTTVVVTPTVGVPYTIHLNKGQVYQYYSVRIAGIEGDHTGTIVKSDKPVAVFGAHYCALVPPDKEYCNQLVEQLYPVNTWGKEYVAMPMAGRANPTTGDRFRVLAAYDNTQVVINNGAPITLNRGKYHETVFAEPIHVVADQPILLIQYSQGAKLSGAPGDPSMMLIPPYEQFLDNYPAVIAAPHSYFTAHYVNIVAPAAAVGFVKLDGTPVTADAYVPISNSGFYGARIPLQAGSHALNGPLPFGVFMYGYGIEDAYSYAGGLTLGEIGKATNITVQPTAATQPISQAHCLTATVTDATGRALPDIRVDFTVSGAHNIQGQDVTASNGEARFCYTGSVTGTDTITARIGTLSSIATVAWVDTLFLNLSLAKTDGQTLVQPGTVLTYTLTITNQGNLAATSVVLTDSLPLSTTFMAASDSGSATGQVVTWNIGTLAARQSLTRTVTVRVDTAFSASQMGITNMASVRDALLLDGNPTDNEAFDDTRVNHRPSAVDDTATTDEATPVTIDVLANDDDADGDSLTIVAVGAPHAGTTALSGAVIVYTPTLSFAGTDVFTYTVSDGMLTDTAKVSVTVVAPSTPPDLKLTKHTWATKAAPGGIISYTLTFTNSGVIAAGGVVITETLPDHTSFYSLTSTPGWRCADVSAVEPVCTLPIGELASGAAGAAIFAVVVEPALPAGVATLTNTAVIGDNGAHGLDPKLDNNRTTVITPIEAAPDLSIRKDDGIATVSAGQIVTYTLVISNVGKQGATGITVIDTLPDHTRFITASQGGSAAGGVVRWPTFSLAAGARITHTVSSQVADPLPAGVTVMTNTVTVADDGSNGVDPTPANNLARDVDQIATSVNPPVLTPIPDQLMNEGESRTLSITASDVDGDLITLAASNLPIFATFTDAGNGTAIMHLAPGYEHAGVYPDIMVTASDGKLTATAFFTITVSNVNRPPVAVDDQASTAEATAVTIAVLANDRDPDGDPLAVARVDIGSNGTVTSNGATVTYTPTVGYVGITVFTYVLSDGNLTATAVITVTVYGVNQPPVAVDDLTNTDEDVRVTLDVVANDRDPDGDPLSISSVGSALHGLVTMDGATVTYSPTRNFNGQDSFIYTVTDGSLPATAQVTVTVNPVNDPPLAADDHASTNENTAVILAVLANDTDPDGDLLTIISVDAVSSGVATIDGANILYTPSSGYTGEASFTYTISDGSITSTAMVTVVVNNVSEAPVITAQPSGQSVCAGSSVNFIAAASGDPTPSVRWQVSTDGGLTWNAVPGATSPTLSFIATAIEHGNHYRAVFTNLAGTATSDAAMLMVNTPPVITTQPANQSVNAGQVVNFNVSATSNPAPAVQWQVSIDRGITWNNIPGATTTTFSFTATSADHGNQYRAIFTNACSIATSDVATVTVNTAPITGILLSSNKNGRAGGLVYRDEDIIAYDPATNQVTMVFDGSDVGLGNTDIDDFAILANGDILLSLERDFTLNNFGRVDDEDVLRFMPIALGDSTKGSYQLYFDGSDVDLGLCGNNDDEDVKALDLNTASISCSDDEDVKGVDLDAEGNLVISVRGKFNAFGVAGDDEDLFVFHATQLGNHTRGSWTLLFDGSDVKLTSSTEEVRSIWSDHTMGELYLATDGNFSVVGANGGLSGDGNDIFICKPGSLGSNTRCEFRRHLDMGALDIIKHSVDGISVGALPMPSIRNASEIGIIAVDDTVELEGDDADEAVDPDTEGADDDAHYFIYMSLIHQ